jgi:hypothetical protein
MTAKRPSERYASMDEVAEALRAYTDAEPTQIAKPAQVPEAQDITGPIPQGVELTENEIADLLGSPQATERQHQSEILPAAPEVFQPTPPVSERQAWADTLRGAPADSTKIWFCAILFLTVMTLIIIVKTLKHDALSPVVSDTYVVDDPSSLPTFMAWGVSVSAAVTIVVLLIRQGRQQPTFFSRWVAMIASVLARRRKP